VVTWVKGWASGESKRGGGRREEGHIRLALRQHANSARVPTCPLACSMRIRMRVRLALERSWKCRQCCTALQLEMYNSRMPSNSRGTAQSLPRARLPIGISRARQHAYQIAARGEQETLRCSPRDALKRSVQAFGKERTRRKRKEDGEQGGGKGEGEEEEGGYLTSSAAAHKTSPRARVPVGIRRACQNAC